MNANQKNIIAHLVELRTCLMRAVAAWSLAFIMLFPWASDLYALLAAPMLAKLPLGGQMIATDVTTPFFVPLKVALLVALLIALPYILYQVWRFVAPALYVHEKRWAAAVVVTGMLLFLCGMAFAYFAVFPVVFGFINAAAPQGVAVMTDIEKYLSFAIGLFFAFGFTFQVPVAVVVMVKLNMVTTAKLREIRPYVIVGAFVVGAIVTPPDVVSQLMLAMPLWVLYEAGIVVSGWAQGKGADKTCRAAP